MIQRAWLFAAAPLLLFVTACEEGVEGEMRRFAVEQERARAAIAWQTTASGLRYRIMEDVSGEARKPGPQSEVLVNYEGKLKSGEVFDSSYDRGQPANFRVDQVIPGWTEALQLMQAGEEFELEIPSRLAYGEAGSGNIGPNEDLLFRVELLAFQTEDGQIVTSPKMQAGGPPPGGQ